MSGAHAPPDVGARAWGAHEPDLAGALLAGGRSTRMGRDKAGLLLRGYTLEARALGVLAWFSDELWLASRTPQLEPSPRIALLPSGEAVSVMARPCTDTLGGEGPLDGLATALRCTARPWVLAMACDMPWVSHAVVGLLLERRASGREAVIPRVDGMWQPLLALYRRERALAVAEALLAAGERSLRALVGALEVCPLDEEAVRAVDPGLDSLDNLNTPDDYARALARGSSTLGPARGAQHDAGRPSSKATPSC